ncbi:swarming motility protein YbiA [Salpingoeca rosetta]|uniref:Swarming motility protein YbiA n=1 Tax=Salpingoeca rosetta (strain ATCC 50818 / BSB-021) TaxID=946362 RepID=F2U0X9_SALR5|nr:swarming motility protein YbiA [Salpingoeca rosetta]EGD80553.1 swarming motility protein YbiA [Salpingoeca rosetta]|eukprot:XP_004997114.1 swarming motility protein YbiA [Salpingoeca rosetta]
MGAIRFYGHTKPFGFMSNFYPAKVVIDGHTWPTTEHYFQAMKFHDKDYQAQIRKYSSPSTAKKLGQTRAVKLRSDWEDVKYDVMYKACLAKFTQHADLRKQLLDTGDAKLIEHTRNDRVWGDGGDGTGQNKLGQVLMEVRRELREKGPSPAHAAHDVAKATDNADDDGDAGDDDDDGEEGTSSTTTAGTTDGVPKRAKRTMLDFVAKDTAPSTSPTRRSGRNVVQYKTGDLLKATEQCIAHQCNAVSTYAKGLSKVIFSRYPQADLYTKQHKQASKKSKPGTTQFHAGKPHCVINMVAQRSPGRPRASETAEQRLEWFKECLAKIAANKDIESVAFPYMIGCGLAGGKWEDYKAAIASFAARNPHIQVAIYKLPA